MSELMSARRAVQDSRGDAEATVAARNRVDAAKIGLGERGPGWWDDGAPDYNRKLVKNSPYLEWFSNVEKQCGRST